MLSASDRIVFAQWALKSLGRVRPTATGKVLRLRSSPPPRLVASAGEAEAVRARANATTATCCGSPPRAPSVEPPRRHRPRDAPPYIPPRRLRDAPRACSKQGGGGGMYSALSRIYSAARRRLGLLIASLPGGHDGGRRRRRGRGDDRSSATSTPVSTPMSMYSVIAAGDDHPTPASSVAAEAADGSAAAGGGQRSSPRPCRRCFRRRRWWCWRSTRRGTTGRRRSGWRSGRWSRAGTSSAPAATPSSCSACSTPSPIPVRATLPLLFPRVTFSQLFLLELKLPLLLTPTAQKLYLDELTFPKCCLVAFCIYIVLHN